MASGLVLQWQEAPAQGKARGGSPSVAAFMRAQDDEGWGAEEDEEGAEEVEAAPAGPLFSVEMAQGFADVVEAK